MDEFDIVRKNVFQAEAINGMGVPAANFHHAVMAAAFGQTANLVGRRVDYLGIAKFIDKLHP